MRVATQMLRTFPFFAILSLAFALGLLLAADWWTVLVDRDQAHRALAAAHQALAGQGGTSATLLTALERRLESTGHTLAPGSLRARRTRPGLIELSWSFPVPLRIGLVGSPRQTVALEIEDPRLQLRPARECVQTWVLVGLSRTPIRWLDSADLGCFDLQEQAELGSLLERAAVLRRGGARLRLLLAHDGDGAALLVEGDESVLDSAFPGCHLDSVRGRELWARWNRWQGIGDPDQVRVIAVAGPREGRL